MPVKTRKTVRKKLMTEGKDEGKMSETKNTMMEQRIEQFCKSSEELLTGLHARKKSGDKTSLNKKRRMQDTFSIPDQDSEFHGDENLDDLL